MGEYGPMRRKKKKGLHPAVWIVGCGCLGLLVAGGACTGLFMYIGVQTVNEIRELRDMGEPLEGGDESKGGGETPPALLPFTGEENGNGNAPKPEEEEQQEVTA